MRMRSAAPVALTGMIAGVALGVLTLLLIGNPGSPDGGGANAGASAPIARER